MADHPTDPTARSDWRARFLRRLALRSNVAEAARFAGINRCYAYEVRAEDPEFAAAWEAAEQEAVDRLEAEAFRRARAQSDTLLIFLLKAHRREKYGDRLTVTVLQKLQREVAEMSEEDLLAAMGYDEQRA